MLRSPSVRLTREYDLSDLALRFHQLGTERLQTVSAEKLILLFMRGTGPLNEPPRPFRQRPYTAERLRIMFRKPCMTARRCAAEGAIDGLQLPNALEYGLPTTIRSAMMRSRSMPDDPE